MLTGISPILLVTDLERSCDWWRDKVGFEGGVVADGFAILERDGVSVFLARSPEPAVYWKVVEKMWNVYIRVDDVDALYAEVQKRGAELDYGISNKAHGMREFGLSDPDGHDIAFGQPIG